MVVSKPAQKAAPALNFVGGASAIMTPAEIAVLCEMLRTAGGHKTLTKLPLSGGVTTDFWGAVQGKGRILTVVKHKTSGAVFGGYVEDTFTPRDYGDRWIPGSANNFIFRLDGAQPIKLLHNPGDARGVELSSDHGLCMGGGTDLMVMHDTVGYGNCSPTSYTTCAPGYTIPIPLQKGTLAGLPSTATWPMWTAPDVAVEVYQCS